MTIIRLYRIPYYGFPSISYSDRRVYPASGKRTALINLSRGLQREVAQCDCWVTSYPEYFFGNMFREPDLTRMLKTSRARRDFVERPKHLVEHDDCLSCRYLSICHGGWPVRIYSSRGATMAKDPYCEVYKIVFARSEIHARTILRSRLATSDRSATTRDRASRKDSNYQPN